MLTQQKTLPVWTTTSWQAFCYSCNPALPVSFTKTYTAVDGSGVKWGEKVLC